MSTRLQVSLDKDVLVLALDASDGYPRLERALLERLGDEIVDVNADAGILGVAITGGAESFAAGAEIAEIAVIEGAGGFEFSRAGQRVCDLIERSRKPVIAAIRGYCMGGGLDLALACHERIATADAVFAHPGGAIGIMTGWGGTQRLPRLIGRARALEMFVTGGRLSAAGALEWGLVARVVQSDELLSVAIGCLERLGRRTGTAETSG